MQLAKRAITGTVFFATSTYLVDIIGLARSIILARLLVPEYFGVVALASFFFNLFKQFKEFNFDTALIHKAEPSDEAFCAHFILKVSLALINLLIIGILSPFLSRLYGADIVKIIIIFTFFSIFQEASSTPRVFLEKEILFVKISLVNIVRELIKTAVPIIMALRGFGLWSLVAMGVLDMIIPFFGYMVTKTWRIRFRFNKEMIIWFFKFSWYMWVGGLCLMFMYEFDNFLVGTMVGAVALGLYAKAYEFAKIPTRMVTHIITTISLPLYSKLKDDKIKLSQAFNNFLYIIVRLALPFALVFFIIAPEFVYLFLGSKWSGAIIILRLLVAYSILRAIQDDCGAVLYALGNPKAITRIFLIQSFFMIVLCPVFIYFLGVNGAAIFVDLMIAFGVILVYKKVSSYVDLEFRKNFVMPLISAGFGVLLVFFFLRFFHISNLGNRLMIKLVIFLCSYGAVLVLFSKDELKDKFGYMSEELRRGR